MVASFSTVMKKLMEKIRKYIQNYYPKLLSKTMFVWPKSFFDTSFTNLHSPKKLVGSVFILGQDGLA